LSHEISRLWRLRQQRYRLLGEICPDCNTPLFPPRDVCPHCGQDAKEPYFVSRKGKVVSWTTIERDQALEESKELTPYVLATVQTDDGVIITAHLTDLTWEEIEEPQDDGSTKWKKVFNVEEGMEVEMVTRIVQDGGETGLITYGYTFRPLLNPNQKEMPLHFSESNLVETLAEED
jgi:uncharacterized OB-fold protein